MFRIKETSQLKIELLLNYSLKNNLGLIDSEYDLLIQNGAIETVVIDRETQKREIVVRHSCLIKLSNLEDNQVKNIAKKWLFCFEKLCSDPEFKGPIHEDLILPEFKTNKYVWLLVVIFILFIGFEKVYGSDLNHQDTFISESDYQKLLPQIRKVKIPQNPVNCEGLPSKINEDEYKLYQSFYINFYKLLIDPSVVKSLEYGYLEKTHTIDRFKNFTFLKNGDPTLCVGSEFQKMINDPVYRQKHNPKKCKCEEQKND